MVTAIKAMAVMVMAATKKRRRFGIGIGALGLCAVIVMLATAWALFRPGGPPVHEGSSMAQIGGPFALVTHKGEALSDRDLLGAPFAVFFGFTRCPEVCPTTLWEMSQALGELGPDAQRLKVLFISVDPARDTPEFLANYLQSFDPRIVGLTGSEEDIQNVGKAYRAYWRKVPLEDGDYTMDHTASVYLMNAKGQFTGVISYEEDQKTRIEKLTRLLRG